jgi:hypothetical protein
MRAITLSHLIMTEALQTINQRPLNSREIIGLQLPSTEKCPVACDWCRIAPTQLGNVTTFTDSLDSELERLASENRSVTFYCTSTGLTDKSPVFDSTIEKIQAAGHKAIVLNAPSLPTIKEGLEVWEISISQPQVKYGGGMKEVIRMIQQAKAKGIKVVGSFVNSSDKTPSQSQLQAMATKWGLDGVLSRAMRVENAETNARNSQAESISFNYDVVPAYRELADVPTNNVILFNIDENGTKVNMLGGELAKAE